MTQDPVSIQNSSLVGKLKDVKKGDRIRLWKENLNDSYEIYEACGYVTYLTSNQVNLSPNHPLHNPQPAKRGVFFSSQIARYNLVDFSHYSKQVDES